MALGAQRSQVISLVLRDTLALIGIGLLVGFALAAMAQKTLAHIFAAMGDRIWLSFAAATLSLLGAAAIAAFIPALRSATVDPVTALRQE
jgi:ABC-type antimicrobial peptide transport system permease subunit